MNIAQLYKDTSQPVSFEIFPPKGELSYEHAFSIGAQLAKLSPDFMSVTYSAGGSGNCSATGEVAQLIQKNFNIPVMAHLTCINTTQKTLEERISDFQYRNIKNVLALRGDLTTQKAPRDYLYAKELIEILVEKGFCVGAAAYPEGHIECSDMKHNIEHLKQKEAAGASFFITQLFFDNEYFYRFWEQAQASHIQAPISCGIMPFLSKEQVSRMVFMCGASLPSPIIKLLAKYADSPQDLRKAGIEYANAQLVDLAKSGVDGLHVYVMNQPEIARSTMQALSR